MTYIIYGSSDHPFDYYRGVQFELFSIRWEGDRHGGWVRDEEGPRWGFNHPISNKIICVHPAGTGPNPKTGKLTTAFFVSEVGVSEEYGEIGEEE